MSMLVIGAGLLGGALCRVAGVAAEPLRGVPWHSSEDAAEMVRMAVREHVAVPGWRLAWCAGAGVVGTGTSSLQRETAILQVVLDEIESSAGSAGRFFLASSAGGVFGAGSSDHINETTAPNPVSEYGLNKLLQEGMVGRWGALTGHAILVGRISNLYGPGQRLAKGQGLISQSLLRCLLRLPIDLAVPEETQRDYLFADDAAARIAAWMDDQSLGGETVKLLVAGRSVTIAQLMRVVHAVTGVEPRIIRRRSPTSALQPRHLRFRSEVLPQLDLGRNRSIEVGVQQTWSDLVRRHSRAALSLP